MGRNQSCFGKSDQGREGTTAKTNQGKYAICLGVGVGLTDCYFSVATYSSPGTPTTMEFYDATSLNKSVVAKARYECVKAKSVFKSLIDYALDPFIAWLDSMLTNM